MKRWLLFALIVIVLGSCGKDTPRHRNNLRASVDLTRDASFALDTSTDCAEVGQPITFTLTFYSRDERAIEIEAEPPLDIMLVQPTEPPTIVARWSDSDGYPAQIPPLEPDEIRPYIWTWVPTEEVGVLLVNIQLTLRDSNGKTWPASGELATTGVGEAYAQLGPGGILARCSEMAPAK